MTLGREGIRHGGVVFRVGEHLAFLPASVAVKALPSPPIARVPGAPSGIVGVALIDGETVAVVAAAPLLGAGGALLLIRFLGERVALAGVEVLATGRFESLPESVHGEHVLYEGSVARLFDVAAVLSSVQGTRWAV